MLHRVATWWTILRISLEERLVYRVDFALGTLMRFLPIVTQIFLWDAVFAGHERQRQPATIAGYSYHDMIAYYLLTMVGRAFSSMPGLASRHRPRHPRRHDQEVPHPADRHAGLPDARPAGPQAGLLRRGGWRPSRWCSSSAAATSPAGRTPGRWLAFLASLVMSFLLGFFLEATLGMIGFWFLEVSSLLFVYMLVSFFFSGHMFPLDMLPGVWATVVKLIPLQYLAYFPAAVFLGKVSGAELAWGLAVEAVLGRVLLCRRRGRCSTTACGATAASEDDAHGRHAAAYFRVFLTFARNSLVRDMTFRGNFLIDAITSMAWMLLNLAFYMLIFRYTPIDRRDTGWEKYQFFVFFATGLLINSLVQTLFMTNADELSDLIRTGGAGLRPAEADRHAVPRLAAADRLVVAGAISCLGLVLLGYSLVQLDYLPGPRADRALPALRGLRRGDLLQPDDRPGGGHACGWAAT